MKRANPSSKSPIFKILGSLGNNKFDDNGGEQSVDSMMLDSIGCTANVIILD